MKKKYIKPSLSVVELQQHTPLLAGSTPDVPNWGGEGD